MITKTTRMLIMLLALLTISSHTYAASLKEVIESAQQQFGGVAFTAERYSRARGSVYDVELLLSGRRIVEAEFDANTGTLISSEIYRTPRRAERVSAALRRARISLLQAIEIAERRVPNSQTVDAEIKLRRNFYLVEVRAGSFLYEVLIDSRSGRVNRVEVY